MRQALLVYAILFLGLAAGPISGCYKIHHNLMVQKLQHQLSIQITLRYKTFEILKKHWKTLCFRSSLWLSA
jgi:hypothetical protein